MGELKIPSFIQNYMNEIHESEATKRFIKLASEYQEAIDTHIASSGMKLQHTNLWNRTFNQNSQTNFEAERKTIEADYKQKARAIAKEYIRDEAELDRINPEIRRPVIDGDKNITKLQEALRKQLQNLKNKGRDHERD